MTNTVKFEVPANVVERWKQTAAYLWSDEERDEHYEAAVSCGNGDDSYAEGDTQGSAEAYDEVLSYLV